MKKIQAIGVMMLCFMLMSTMVYVSQVTVYGEEATVQATATSEGVYTLQVVGDRTYYVRTADNVVVYDVKKENERVLERTVYAAGTVYGQHVGKEVDIFKYTYTTAGVLSGMKQYQGLNVIQEYTYANGTTYEQTLEENPYTTSFKYVYRADRTLERSWKIVSNSTQSEYVYTAGAMYGGHESKVAYRYDFVYGADGTLQKAFKVQNGRTVSEYYYTAGTTFDTRVTRIAYSNDFVYNTDGTVKKAIKMQNGRAVTEYYYTAGTQFGSHGTRISYRNDFVYNADGTLKKAFKVQGGRTVMEYYYTAGTRYGSHGTRVWMTNEFVYNADGTVKKALQRQNGRVTTEFYYTAGTRFGSHSTRVSYKNVFYYNADGTINRVERVQNNAITMRYYYHAGTRYGSHASRITEILYYSGTTVTKIEDKIARFNKPAGVMTCGYACYTNQYGIHKGMDFDNGDGSPILAAKGGKVVLMKGGCVPGNTTCNGGYGNYIIIDHGNGQQTLYAHQRSFRVSLGQWVRRGTHIGYQGYTGNVTSKYGNGSHLHFELRINGSAVNPISYF